jgi:peroxiredoxin
MERSMNEVAKIHSRRRWTAAGAVLAGMVGLVPASGLAGPGPSVGEPAPAFAAIDSNGKTHRLADYRGRVVVLEWTNHDCPFVRKHYGSGNMQALQKSATDGGAVWLSVISSAPGTQGHVDGAQANRLTAERGAKPTAVLLDPKGEIGRKYDARVTPHMYVIDAKGALAYMGAIDDKPTADPDDVKTAKNHVTAALADVKAGRPAATARTRAYGCTVKYAN